MISHLLIAAIMAVESSSGSDHRDGDRGAAWGALQVHAAVVQDVNRFAHAHYTHADARRPDVAESIFRLYVGHYATAARLGHEPTDADYARVWNGGPQGFRRPATLAYWRRVRRAMEDAHRQGR